MVLRSDGGKAAQRDAAAAAGRESGARSVLRSPFVEKLALERNWPMGAKLAPAL